MKRFSVLAALAASPAAAHELPSAHMHPHGAETVAIGLAAVLAGVAWLVWRRGR